MAAITDLTWTQLNVALKELTGTSSADPNLITTDAYGIPTSINITKVVGGITGSPADPSSVTGVIKFLNRLHDACRMAQESVNQGKAAGEKLSAFGAPTSATPKGNLVPITRTIVSQADLSTATKIVGINV